jgi:hypothetical protein
MAKLLRALLLASPLLLLPPAQAQYYYNYQQLGDYGRGTVTGPDGYQGNYRRQRIGNTTFDTYSDPYGSTQCRTSSFGSISRTSCN